MSKAYLNSWSAVLILVAFLLTGVVSCAPKLIAPSPEPVRVPVGDTSLPQKPLPEKEAAVAAAPSPRMLASLELTQQGRLFIENKAPDNAIRMLERAVSLDPTNGANYYYLAEAWLLKMNKDQATAFNDLAGLHLGSDEKWHKRIEGQKTRIRQMTGK